MEAAIFLIGCTIGAACVSAYRDHKATRHAELIRRIQGKY